jgi:hypothetical protein
VKYVLTNAGFYGRARLLPSQPEGSAGASLREVGDLTLPILSKIIIIYFTMH